MSLELIDRLIALDAESPKRIAVVGDAMIDDYVEGEITGCQDGCPCFREGGAVVVPGGAAGAARQLARWSSETWLVAQIARPRGPGWEESWAGWDDFNGELAFKVPHVTVKTRLLHDGKIVFRHDQDFRPSENAALAEQRRLALQAVREMRFDAVLISDYDKGFLSEELIRDVIAACRERGVPCVADAKRRPSIYRGALLKCNGHYDAHHDTYGIERIVTNGGIAPSVHLPEFGLCKQKPDGSPTPLVNHVGAGDCFAAHLTLALAHGLTLEEAALVAHAAGRVYVQYRHGRPPWPHEVRRDIDPAGGKVVSASLAASLRLSCPRPVVFTNGVFRLPTAAHAELLAWAKAQGATLVVGVNDDVSAFRVKKGGWCLPLAERQALLASMAAVDYVVPFSQDTPEALAESLAPDLLVKGPECRNTEVPGAKHAKEVRFYPGGAFPERHATGLIEEVRRA